MLAESSLRDRRRAATVREIKHAALQQLAEGGTGALSLRGVARTVGMTVQSLYHYFDSRDALITALVSDAHDQLADAVQAAVDETRGRPARERRLSATNAFRTWALANPPAFLLIYGTPVPGYVPPVDSTIGSAAYRLALPFREVVYDGWTEAELRTVPVPDDREVVLPEPGGPDAPDATFGLPPGALLWFLEMRATMHGLVMLEVLGHLRPFCTTGAEMFELAMLRMSDSIDDARPGG